MAECFKEDQWGAVHPPPKNGWPVEVASQIKSAENHFSSSHEVCGKKERSRSFLEAYSFNKFEFYKRNRGRGDWSRHYELSRSRKGRRQF